jgi:hypothetical protein
LPVMEAVLGFALCACRAKAGWAASSNAPKIAPQTARTIPEVIFFIALCRSEGGEGALSLV